jgi:hypothetical protein
VPDGPAASGVTHRPRLRIGDLVLSRRTWTARSADLPLTEPKTAAADRFLGWQRWRARHGVPERVFVRAYEVSGRSQGVGRPGRVKPQYLDFASYHSLTALEAMLGADSRVVFTEMLPDAGELHVRSGRGSHVAELAAETFARTPNAAPAADHAADPAERTTARSATS